MAVPLWAEKEFQQIASKSGNSWRPGGLALTKYAIELCNLKKNAKILDIGCGLGASRNFLIQAGFSAVGLDREIFNMQNRQEVKQDTDLNLKSGPDICADALALPFLPHSFTAILCECVFSLLDKKEDFLKQARQILAINGYLILTDLFSLSEKSNKVNLGQSCHEKALPKSELDLLFQKANFRIVHYEDQTKYLKQLAAQLIWYGQIASSKFCSCQSGYGLWILQRD